MSNRILFGFHAVTVRLKMAPGSVIEIHLDPQRRDARMRQFADRARDAGAKLVDSAASQLDQLAGSSRHQGVVARVKPLALSHSLDIPSAGAVVADREPPLGVGLSENRPDCLVDERHSPVRGQPDVDACRGGLNRRVPSAVRPSGDHVGIG